MSTDPTASGLSSTGLSSTGRGGAGNIGRDLNTYADGSIIREGTEGGGQDVAHSLGRGGAGNIATPKGTPDVQAQRRDDSEIVPETALRHPAEGHENFHTGRGGEGNIHRDRFGGHSAPPKEHKEPAAGEHKEGFGDKIKHALHLDKKDTK